MVASKKAARPKPPKNYDDNPVWSAADFARARPAKDVMPEVVAAPKKLGRPKSDNPKIPISLRLDADVVYLLKKTGEGWQSRANDALVLYVIRRKYGDTNIATLRKMYGSGFAAGISGKVRLSRVMDRLDQPSLSKLRRSRHH